jgi:DNA-binding LacI/PurR family transcriptional regulator
VDESLVAFASQTSELHAYVASRGFFTREAVPTAVVAARDMLAQGVCHAIEEAGFQVGYDISVIGFDNVSWGEGQNFLTTFAEPCYEMGRLAVEMLFDRLYNGWRPPERRVLEAPLVLRRSVGPVPREALQPRGMASAPRA